MKRWFGILTLAIATIFAGIGTVFVFEDDGCIACKKATVQAEPAYLITIYTEQRTKDPNGATLYTTSENMYWWAASDATVLASDPCETAHHQAGLSYRCTFTGGIYQRGSGRKDFQIFSKVAEKMEVSTSSDNFSAEGRRITQVTLCNVADKTLIFSVSGVGPITTNARTRYYKNHPWNPR